MVVGILTGHRILLFEVTNGNAGAHAAGDEALGPGLGSSWSFAGYVTPPLLGLGGAALLDAGQILPLLWTAVVLLVLTLFKAEREWTTFVVLLLAAGHRLRRAVRRRRCCRRALAAGLVWLLLFGGAADAVRPARREGHRSRPPLPRHAHSADAVEAGLHRGRDRAVCGRAPSSWFRRSACRTAARGARRVTAPTRCASLLTAVPAGRSMIPSSACSPGGDRTRTTGPVRRARQALQATGCGPRPRTGSAPWRSTPLFSPSSRSCAAAA